MEELNMSKFGTKIYDLRVNGKNETLRTVAFALGISAMYLSELETGVKMPVRSKVIPKIAEYYNQDVEELKCLLQEDIKNAAIETAKNGTYAQAFAAARKSPAAVSALENFLRQEREK